MPFSLLIGPKAEKFIEKSERVLSARLLSKIEALSANPFPSDVKRVEHKEFEGEIVFRVRVGDYRVLYTVNFSTSRVLVFRIDRRERVY